MAVKFEDNSIKVKGAINDAMIAWLYEASAEIKAETVRNCTRNDTGQTKGAWTTVVNESKGEAVVGNPLQNAIWEEFGTGEYAIHGDGRKGWWVYVKDSSTGTSTKSGGKQYTKEEAERAVAYLRSKGLDAHMTKGKTPIRALEKAYNTKKEKVKSRAESIMKGLN